MAGMTDRDGEQSACAVQADLTRGDAPERVRGHHV